MNKRKLILIDSLAIINTTYYGYRNNPTYTNEGFPNFLLQGMYRYLKNLHSKNEDHHVVFITDSPQETYRTSMFPDYKKSRPDKDEDYKLQIDLTFDLIRNFGYPIFVADGFEGDDLLATFSKRCKKSGLFDYIEIHTGDKDIYQTIDDVCVVFNLKKKCIVNKQNLLEHFPVLNHHVVDFLTMTGDSVDDVLGIDGCGQVSAVKLLQHFNSLENIIENLKYSDYKTIGIKKNIYENILNQIENNLENILLCKKLILLKDDIEINISTKAIQRKDIETNLLDTFAKFYEIKK